jgi:hypothetical protein
MHGNQEGVQLTNYEFVAWDSLRHLLVPWNRWMSGHLLVSMASCFGTSGARMSMSNDPEYPFWALIGNTQVTALGDLAVGFAAFYHRLFKGADLETCRLAMVWASGNNDFLVMPAADCRRTWQDVVTGGPSLSEGADPATLARVLFPPTAD